MSSEILNTRDRILEAAWKQLEINQGTGVRMGDIARQAGISRQALYLHFSKRAELLIATTRYIDEVKGVDARLAASRGAATGVERLDAYIEAWGNYIPEIYAVARALLAMRETDAAAAAAWTDRMQAMRHGCEAAVAALQRDNLLSAEHSLEDAVDILWMLLSVRTWEELTIDCGWPQRKYVATTKAIATRLLVADTATA